MNKTSNRKKLIVIPISLVISVWFIYMFSQNAWGLFKDFWFMSVTMVFGSFIAGASAEGGGAVAFPVMTLIFKIPPGVARNFGLAIQSIGMNRNDDGFHTDLPSRHQSRTQILVAIEYWWGIWDVSGHMVSGANNTGTLCKNAVRYLLAQLRAGAVLCQ